MNKVKNPPQAISVIRLPIKTPVDKVNLSALDNKKLIEAICEYRRYLEKNDVEIFSRNKNILATSSGYFIAFFEEDLRNMEGGIDNPIPYFKKGRKMVEVVAEDGRKVEKDLAELVAMTYCSNPKRYKRVYFKDYNADNCTADNLFWCSEISYQAHKLLTWIYKIFHSAKGLTPKTD